MDITTISLFFVGLIALVWGADVLVYHAASLSARWGISPLIIGLTVVALGTSAPEMAVGIYAGLTGQHDLLVGNVVGSNIANILLILGLSALLAPLVVHKQLLRIDLPIMIGTSILVYVLCLDGQLSTGDGLLLVVCCAGYLWVCLRTNDPNVSQIETPNQQGQSSSAHKNIVMIIVGLALLTLGARWLIDSASTLARLLGMSELLIGLTVVAIGTSLPEIAATIAASLRGNRDMAIGNVVGSCTLNLMAVLGVSATVSSQSLAISNEALYFDMPIMLATSVLCLPIFLTQYAIARWEGSMLFGGYVIYTLYLIVQAQNHPALLHIENIILYMLMPISFLILLISGISHIKKQPETIKSAA